jgi:two-component system, LytTR family, sensor kinase
MKNFWKQFRFLQLHYFVISFTIFFGGWLVVTKGAGETGSNFFICLLYSLGIAINSFIIERYLLSNFLYRRQKSLFILFTILLFAVTGFILLFFQNTFGNSTYLLQVKNSQPISFLLSYFFPLAFAAIITTVAAIFRNQQSTILKMEKLNTEKLQTELNFLKAQINPHFLFNSLNSVYFQIDKQNTAARDTLMKFTEMLRYQLYDCNVDRISIADEINFLKNYISLQQLRKGDKYKMNFKAAENVNGFAIAPLILITFLENSFKYLSNKATGENVIEVKLEKENSWFIFSCFNTTDETAKPDVMDYGGIGVVNTKRRLDILYGDDYNLTIDNAINHYNVILKIKLAT